MSTARRPAIVAIVAVALAAGAGATPAAGQAPSTGASTVAIPIQPAVAGVPLVLDGNRYVSDARGMVVVPATAGDLADDAALLHRRIRILPARLGPTLRVRFSRWVGRTATVVLLRPVRLTLADPGGRPLEASVAPRIVVRGTDGSRLALPSGAVSWLPSTQAIRRPRGEWLRRRLSYAVKEVRTHGTNVVHRGEQRFAPSVSRRVTISVLFFSARFSARDALFGTPIGNAVVVRFPDGHVERHELGSTGQLALAGLPRGEYVVNVEGPGISFAQPVALSRSQEVELRIISWIDIAIVTVVLVVVAVALAVVRRPTLRRPSRMRRSPAGDGGHG